jgi:hypothetical protein
MQLIRSLLLQVLRGDNQRAFARSREEVLKKGVKSDQELFV